MRKLNATIPDSMLVSRILSILPGEYQYFHSAWDSTSPTLKTLDNLTTRLLTEEQKLKTQSTENVDDGLVFATKQKDTDNFLSALQREFKISGN